MKNVLFVCGLLFCILFAACSKNNKEGTITYQVTYHLPDSLSRFAAFLPKQATIYFKGDSAVSVQQINDESTTVITDKAAGFMRVLLRSATKQYVVDYSAKDQAEEASLLPKYKYIKIDAMKTIAGYKAIKYILVDKTTGDSTFAWFTKEIHILPSYISMNFDASLGVPLVFTTNQNGIVSTTAIKQIKFESVPDGVFSTPAGYTPITPRQLREMPVDN
jgi:hypothetical protein